MVHVCFYWVLLHMCKVCVCFFPGLDCMCMFFVTVRCMCALKALTLFFPWAWRHFLVPPSAQTPSLFLCPFYFFPLNPVQQFTGSGFISPFHFFVYSEFITQIFSPCLFSRIHKPQQFQIPWLCTFSKPHLKTS